METCKWLYDHLTILSANVAIKGEMPPFKCRKVMFFCMFVCGATSGHGGCVHRGASVLQQSGGHRQPQGSEKTQGLSFQEGN